MNTPPDRDRLHAFADDRLPADERVRVAGWLADHPDSAAAVHDWRRQNAALHAAYDGVLEQSVPPHLLAPPTPTPRPLLRVAAVLGWLALGIVIGRVLPPDGPAATVNDPLAALPHRAAVAYAVYVPEVRHPVEVGADQESHLVAWLSKRLGTPLRAPHLVAEGFRLVGGRLIPSEQGPGALFMYEDGTGARLTLYVVTVEHDGGETAFRFAHAGALSTFYWVDRHTAYALSGELPRASLLPVASAVYRQLGEDRPPAQK
mgnify:CR=1 FL=1